MSIALPIFSVPGLVERELEVSGEIEVIDLTTEYEVVELCP